MRILSFLVENHRSFRDEFSLDMTRQSFKTVTPRKGQSWQDATQPVAAIFGPNASGKSTILDAMRYCFTCIKDSASIWLKENRIPRTPFQLRNNAASFPSVYSLDFTLQSKCIKQKLPTDEMRFHYEFSVSERGINHELLLGYYSSRPTRLIERDLEKGITAWHRNMGPKISVTNRELVLSRGFVSSHPVLAPFVHNILNGIDFFEVDNNEQHLRLRLIADDIASGRIPLSLLASLATVADTGITNINLDESQATGRLNDYLRKLRKLNLEFFQPNVHQDVEEADSPIVQRALRFQHNGAQESQLLIKDESSGTLGWLAMAVPIIEALKDGTLLCVDELDTSLHPSLAGEIVGLFQSRETNPLGAQLIFTSHDIGLLLPHSPAELNKEQIWFTEKDSQGVSTLFSLQDFTDIKKDSNIAKRYFEGYLGALPYLAPSHISGIVEDLREYQENKKSRLVCEQEGF